MFIFWLLFFFGSFERKTIGKTRWKSIWLLPFFSLKLSDEEIIFIFKKCTRNNHTVAEQSFVQFVINA